MADAPTYPPLPPKRELGMGLMYEPVEGFNADDMRAFVDADRAARASRPQPSQPLTDAQVGDLCGEANRGYCIESEHYFKAFRDAEEAHGITGRATPSPPVAAPPATPVAPEPWFPPPWDEQAKARLKVVRIGSKAPAFYTEDVPRRELPVEPYAATKEGDTHADQ